MPHSQLTGSRIRERRLDRGMRQADLAQRVGISASYLNLIEHNRRRIGGKLLHALARELGADATMLTAGAEGALVDKLRAAALSGVAAAPGDAATAEEFAGRFPFWAGLVVAQARRIDLLEGRVAELTDRLAHDPQLAASLHQVISAVTSIRSTASILVSGEEIDRDWRRRFHGNIHEDSLKLAESSRALVAFLEGPDEAGMARTPREEVEALLDARGHHLPELEGPDAATPEAVAEAMAGPQDGAARSLLRDWLRRYRADALAMPLDRLLPVLRDSGFDPSAVLRAFDADPAAVLRRLASLPQGEGPHVGLAICDAAGALIHLRQTAGFFLSRGAESCPLWPLFQALGRPGTPLVARVALPGPRATRLVCHAVAQPRGPQHFGGLPQVEATMLVRPDTEGGADAVIAVGTACRVCPRHPCPARREPSILTGQGTDAVQGPAPTGHRAGPPLLDL